MVKWQSLLPSEPAPQLGRCDKVKMRLCEVGMDPNPSNYCLFKRKERGEEDLGGQTKV